MKQMNMKAIVAVAAIGMSVCGFAAGGTTVSILPLGGAGGAFVSAFHKSATWRSGSSILNWSLSKGGKR